MPRRPSWKEAFFSQRRITSKLKHLILSQYVKEFAYHLGSKHATVFYVDGFAGRGTYKHSDGDTEEGSPLLVARLAEGIRSSGATFRLKCLNVEENRKNFADLKMATAPYMGEIVTKNFHATFVDALPEILSLLGPSPAFVFIDPFGTKGIAFEKLLPMYQRNRTEVFITLHTDGIAKKAGYFASTEDPDATRAGTARKFTAILAAALNLSVEELREWWKECVEENRGGTPVLEERVLRYYIDLLRASMARFAFIKAFPIYYYRADEPPDLSSPICFYLVFASRHKLGLYKMNDAMADALDRFYAEEYRHTFYPLFRAEIDKTKDAAELKQLILTRFRGAQFSIDQVKQRLMQEAKFLIKASGYRGAIMELRRENRPRTLTPGPISNERTFFHVSH